MPCVQHKSCWSAPPALSKTPPDIWILITGWHGSHLAAGWLICLIMRNAESLLSFRGVYTVPCSLMGIRMRRIHACLWCSSELKNSVSVNCLFLTRCPSLRGCSTKRGGWSRLAQERNNLAAGTTEVFLCTLVSNMSVGWLKTAVCLGPRERYGLSPPLPGAFQSLVKKTPPPLPMNSRGLEWAIDRTYLFSNKMHSSSASAVICICLFPSLFLLSFLSSFPPSMPSSSVPLSYLFLPFASCLSPVSLPSPRLDSHSFAVFSQCLRWPICSGCPSLDPEIQSAAPASAVKVRATLEAGGMKRGIIMGYEIVK